MLNSKFLKVIYFFFFKLFTKEHDFFRMKSLGLDSIRFDLASHQIKSKKTAYDPTIEDCYANIPQVEQLTTQVCIFNK